MTKAATSYITLVITAGTLVLSTGSGQWRSADTGRFITYLCAAVATSGLKVGLPSIKSTLSLNFFFVLVGVIHLTLSETLVVGCASILFQYLWKGKSARQAVQAAFNIASGAIGIYLAYSVFHWPWMNVGVETPIALAATAAVYYLANTVQVAAVIALTEERRPLAVWMDCYFWMMPLYLMGAWLAGMFDWATRYAGWSVTVLSISLLLFVYRFYHLYLKRLQEERDRAEEQRGHAEQMASLHLRTIEALALAIEAKDQDINQHLQRVQIFAVEIGRELGLSDSELDALRAAALLHDIGKLAVPEHIIAKPGKLSPEEFEKMKIHPIVGAEILECVRFPYDVASIVRAHHEKWDGTGYPAGLSGERIPIGARILSAVDCLDALTIDRQYRRAVTLQKSVEVVSSEAGMAYDPRVVDIIQRRYLELEEKARAVPEHHSKVSTGVKVKRAPAPVAGLTASAPKTGEPRVGQMPFIHAIGAAHEEGQVLFEMAAELGSSLRLDETLSMLSVRLKRLIPYNTMAVYRRVDEALASEFASGDEARLFGGLEIPLGEGLSGWVAKHAQAIVNGNPSVEPGYLNDPHKFSNMRSALSVPLIGTSGVVGVLTLYDAGKDAFSRDHLRILQAVSSKLGLTIENGLKFRRAEDRATLDFLTGLANARSLFVQLEQEVNRCIAFSTPLAVLVGDLNGFKQVNDKLGHLEGNRLLKLVATALRSECRPQDFVARMGGDEFVVILPDVTAEQVPSVASRCARAVEDSGGSLHELVAAGGFEGGLNLALGVAHLGPDGQTPEQLLAIADRRMYVAKAEMKRGIPSIARLGEVINAAGGLTCADSKETISEGRARGNARGKRSST